MLRYKNRN